MDRHPTSADFCAHCQQPLEIVTVRFKLAGAEIILACPNCPITGTENAATDQESDGSARMRAALSPSETDRRSSIHADGTFPGNFMARVQERAWFY